jgi:predicted O-methyltransferase YrrM
MAVNVPRPPTYRRGLRPASEPAFPLAGPIMARMRPLPAWSEDPLLESHLAQAARSLPGPDYYAVLGWIHTILRPATYVEIGIRQGGSLRAALPETLCLAVDPAPDLAHPAPANWQVFPVTSDEFFERRDLARVFGGRPFDLAFIDGLHLFEQALRDFVHLERWAGPDSLIMIHDCLPLDQVTSQPNRTTHFYSGDVWKVAACLRQQRPNLHMTSIRTAPTGLCLVAGLDPSSTLLERTLASQVSRYGALDYAYYRGHPETMPQTIENTFDAVEGWLQRVLRSLPRSPERAGSTFLQDSGSGARP